VAVPVGCDAGLVPTRSAAPTVNVRWPVMTQRWETLTFLHWSYPVDVVHRLLPQGLEVDIFDGRAWVGLVPFRMTVGPAGIDSIPWFGQFLETNVRTYVRDRSGRPGLWFLSLDAAGLAAVVTARVSYRLPYFWSTMSLCSEGDLLRYQCVRRWPGAGASSLVEVETGPAYDDGELDDRDHFLTARWRLFSHGANRLRYAEAHHQPWPLRRAELRRVDDGLLLAAGLPAPRGSPLVHYSDGVRARIGPPHLVDR
jgi:uncharacterized protein YqjF (DUF2071 family)